MDNGPNVSRLYFCHNYRNYIYKQLNCLKTMCDAYKSYTSFNSGVKLVTLMLLSEKALYSIIPFFCVHVKKGFESHENLVWSNTGSTERNNFYEPFTQRVELGEFFSLLIKWASTARSTICRIGQAAFDCGMCDLKPPVPPEQYFMWFHHPWN